MDREGDTALGEFRVKTAKKAFNKTQIWLNVPLFIVPDSIPPLC